MRRERERDERGEKEMENEKFAVHLNIAIKLAAVFQAEPSHGSLGAGRRPVALQTGLI